MNGSFEIEVHSFLNGLHRAAENILRQSTNALYRTGQDVMNETKRLAPVNTGRLRASYEASQGTDPFGPYVIVGSAVLYAKDQEFGTRYQHGKSHFRPALAHASIYWTAAARIIGG